MEEGFKFDARAMSKEPLPPGGHKMKEALKRLMKQKEFNAITTSEIAKVSGANEALIYKYFGSKRGLLHAVLWDYLYEFIMNLDSKLRGIKGALNNLRKIIWEHINLYETQPVIGKILILEARNYPGFFESDVYNLIKDYTKRLRNLIDEGMRTGEIRDEIPVMTLVRVIMGTIEHVCMTKVVFAREISADDLTEEVCSILFDGIAKTE
jgi:AcrR family transcriptional regulator